MCQNLFFFVTNATYTELIKQLNQKLSKLYTAIISSYFMRILTKNQFLFIIFRSMLFDDKVFSFVIICNFFQLFGLITNFQCF